MNVIEPSTAETLAAKYSSEWEIWRELLPDSTHGDWIARRWSGTDRPELRAATVEELAGMLAGES